MIYYEEIITLDRQYYFLTYDIYSIHIPIEIYLVDNNNNHVRQFNILQLPSLPYTTYDVVIDYERNMLIFNKSIIGSRIKIGYFSTGNPNLFKSFAELPYFLHQFSVASKYKIVDGMYIFREHFDEVYNMRISKGSFVYNGIFYTTPEKIFDLRQYANITYSNIYQGYRFIINNTAIENYVDNQKKVLHDFIVITSEQYGNYQDCYKNLNEKLKNQYPNEFNIIVGDIIVVITQDNRWEYWIDYHTPFRAIVYNL